MILDDARSPGPRPAAAVAGQALVGARAVDAATIDVPVAPKALFTTPVHAGRERAPLVLARTVSLRPPAGTAVPLPETATPGTYTSCGPRLDGPP